MTPRAQLGFTILIVAIAFTILGAFISGKITFSLNGIQLGDRGEIDLVDSAFVQVTSTMDVNAVHYSASLIACDTAGQTYVSQGDGTNVCQTAGGGGGGGSVGIKSEGSVVTDTPSYLDFQSAFQVAQTLGGDTDLYFNISNVTITESVLEGSFLTDVTNVITDNDSDDVGTTLLNDGSTSPVANYLLTVSPTDTEQVYYLATSSLGIVGGSGNSFETMNAPAGTDPVADSSTDTLNLTSSTIDITGDSGTDTLDFEVATDAVGTAILNDGSDTPVAGECLLVATATTEIEYGTCAGGGGGGATFWTMDFETGTDAVVDTASDTLHWVGLGNLTITGSTTDDTVEIAYTESDPTLTDDGAVTIGDGSSGNVNVSFDGDAGANGLLTWDVTNDIFDVDLGLNISNTGGDSAPLSFEPDTGTNYSLYVDNAADDLQIEANTASTERVEFSNIGAGDIDVAIDSLATGGTAECVEADSTGTLTLTGTGCEPASVIGSFSIISPTESDDGFFQAEMAEAITLTTIACWTDAAGQTVTIQFDERGSTTPNSAGTDVLTTPLECDSDRAESSAFDNAVIAAGAILSMDVDTVSGTPGVVRVSVTR